MIDNELQNTSTHTTCYFFFKDNEEQDSLAIALCALLHQAFSAQPELLQYVIASWDKNGKKILSEVHELWRILLTTITSKDTYRVTVVLDALDECREKDRQTLIELLFKFYVESSRPASRSSCLKFLVISRPCSEIEDTFRGIEPRLPMIRLRGELENDRIHEEIDLVIQQRVATLADVNGLSPNLGIGYGKRYQRTRAMTDLETAIQRHQEAVDITPADHPNRAGRLQSLGLGYGNRYQRTGAIADLERTTQPLQEALGATFLDHSASPEPSSEFVDSAYGTASHGGGIPHKMIGSIELVSEEQAADDTKTEYSELSTASSVMRTYTQDLADDLFSAVYIPQTDSKHMRRLCEVLTDFLQQFALRIGQEVSSKEGREVMYYVYRNRRCVFEFKADLLFSNALGRRIVELFEQQCSDKNDDEEEERSVLKSFDTIPVQEKVSNWFAQDDYDIPLLEETIIAFSNEPELGTDDERNQVNRYREWVTRTSAYSWLLAIMRRELALVTQEENILNSIRNEINRSFPPVSKISAQRQPDAGTSLFRVNWDLAAFIVEQEYSENNFEAMEEAITLTGSLTDAQALPCIQYLRQTWPLSGEYTFRLLQKLIDSEYGESIEGMMFAS